VSWQLVAIVGASWVGLFLCLWQAPTETLALLVGAVFVVRWILNRGSDDE